MSYAGPPSTTFDDALLAVFRLHTSNPHTIGISAHNRIPLGELSLNATSGIGQTEEDGILSRQLTCLRQTRSSAMSAPPVEYVIPKIPA